MALKPRITGNGNRVCTGNTVVGFNDGAAEKCGHAEHGKIAAGDKIDAGCLVSGSGDRSFADDLAATHCRHSRIRRCLLAKIMKERIGEQSPVPIRNRVGTALSTAVTKQHQFARILNRQRPKHDGIYQRKNSRVGPDAQRQRQQRDRREPGRFAQLPKPETHVLPQVFEPQRSAALAAILFCLFHAAKL